MQMTIGRIIGLISSLVLLIAFLTCASNIWENVDADELVVIQSPYAGNIVWYTTPGLKMQWFGKVTRYQKRSQYLFTSAGDNKTDQSLKVKFNDGGNATISGELSWELPLDSEHLTSLHMKYGSYQAIEQQLIRPVIEKSVYFTGPHMSSTESFAARRAELLHLLEDQAQNGIILVQTSISTEKDSLTGLDKTVTTVEIEKDKSGTVKRSTESPLAEFNIKTFNYTINGIKYEDRVEHQIIEQQNATMAVQLAIINSKKAEQDIQTTKKMGEADAAKAEWTQKALAAKAEQEAIMKRNVAVTNAQEKYDVALKDSEQKFKSAELSAKAAEQKKLEEIALGEGESQRRKLVMEADGALEKKLAALVEINKAYAEAMGKQSQVPHIQFSGNNQTQGNASTNLIDLLTVKTAKDLSLDFSLPKK